MKTAARIKMDKIKNKKSQLTVFMIIGIVLVIIVLALVFFFNALREDKTGDPISETQELSSDLEPLVNYVESCVERISKKGLKLVTGQGGIIDVEQGGVSEPARLPEELGEFYLEYGDYKPIYLITLPKGEIYCKTVLPDYPVADFPYPYYWKTSTTVDLTRGKKYDERNCFGKPKTISMDNIKEDLTSYIEKNMVSDCDLSIFKEFSVEKGQPKVKISFLPSTTEINVDYPLRIVKSTTGSTTNLNQFKKTIKVGIPEFVEFITMIKQNDADDPTYDIRNKFTKSELQALSYRHEYDISVVNDVSGTKDDLIKVTSPSFVLDSEPFEFVFARKNRYPALEYVYNVSFGDIVPSLNKVINWSSVIHQKLEAVDPDEDDVDIKVMIGSGNYAAELTNSTSFTITNREMNIINAGNSIPVKILATDGQYEDYQMFNIG